MGFVSQNDQLPPNQKITYSIPYVVAGQILDKLKGYDISLTWEPRK